MSGPVGGDSINTAKRKEKQGEIAKLHEKTFRAWINKQLKKKNIKPLNSLFEDLEDGIALITILETLSGQKCPGKPTPNPKMEIQKSENLTIAIEFGKTLFPITSINPKDIMDAKKNPKLLLGLFWQMILHFQILGAQDPSAGDKKTSNLDRQRNAKEKLLKWCQEQTKGHKNVDITDLSAKSWGDGMGFCALVHAYNPSALDYDSLDPADKKGNLKKAFELAEKYLEIPPFLDPEDILSDNVPDEQCFITYLSEFPLAFLNKAASDSVREKEEEARRKAREDEERRLAEERRLRELADLEAERKRKEEEAEKARLAMEEERKRREKEEKKTRKAQQALDDEKKNSEEEIRKREEEERKRKEAEDAFEKERLRLQQENEAIKAQLNNVKKKLIGKIQVVVSEARSLPKADHLGKKSDPYCVLFLERQKEKTRTVKKTLNPKWQAEFEFYVSEPGANLEVSVFDWNRIFSDELIGKVNIPISSLKDGATEDKWYPLVGKEGKKDRNAGEIKLQLTYRCEK